MALLAEVVNPAVVGEEQATANGCGKRLQTHRRCSGELCFGTMRGEMSMPERRRHQRTRGDPVTVIGAGPAGLACAIALARAGRSVVVREWHRDVGTRFHGDYQGLENWSATQDVLDELRAAGIETTFDHHAVSAGAAFDDRGRRFALRSSGRFTTWSDVGGMTERSIRRCCSRHLKPASRCDLVTVRLILMV